jgi:hypothetical protein
MARGFSSAYALARAAAVRVAPEVSRRKFAAELLRLNLQVDALNARGIFLAGRPEFPTIDLVYVPRSPLGLQVNVQGAESQPTPGRIHVASVPPLAARAFKARFDLTDYDLRAPSIEFLDPWTSSPIAFAELVRGQAFEATRGLHPVILNPHPTTGLPFLCLRGVREYHEHPQHSGDDWLLYRSAINVFALALSLWRVTIDLVRPVLARAPTGLQVLWVAEEKR